MGEEEAANKFAEKILKADEILKCFKPYKKYISRDRVIKCAQKIKVSSAIIVGILQHYSILLRRNLNEFKHTVSELIPQAYLAEKYINKI